MGLFSNLKRRFTAKRRWRIAEPTEFAVRISPDETAETLFAKCGFTNDLDPRIVQLVETPPQAVQIRRFELINLCHIPPTPRAEELIANLKAGGFRGDLGGAMELIIRTAQEEQENSTDPRPSHVGIEKAPALMDRLGYIPATAREFLEFFAQIPPDRRRPGDSIALGAVLADGQTLSVLEVFDRPSSGEFALRLSPMKSAGFFAAWMSHHRFLARRKSQF